MRIDVDPAVMRGAGYTMRAGVLEVHLDEAWRRSAAGQLLEDMAASEPERFVGIAEGAVPELGDDEAVRVAKVRLLARMHRMWIYARMWAL